MNENKKISREEAEIFKNENNIKLFYEVSAKNDSQDYLKDILKKFINNSNINYLEEVNNTLNYIPEIKSGNISFGKKFCENCLIF